LKRSLLSAVVLISVLALIPGNVLAEKKLVVGGKNYTEQYLLPQLGALLLEQAGFQVTVKTGVGSKLLRQSLENGMVDLYFEYTGTAYAIFFKGKDRAVMTNPEKIFEFCRQQDEKNGLVWLDRFHFNNTYTLMLREADSKRLGIVSISDLADYVNNNPKALIFAMKAEDWERPDAFKGIMKTYGFKVPPANVKKMDYGLTYMAMKKKKADCAFGYATDGRVAAFHFVNLVDDKNFFPVYNPAPVVRKDTLDRYPQIAEILRPLTQAVTTREMQEMNAAVAIEHRPDVEVARDYLKKKGLLK